VFLSSQKTPSKIKNISNISIKTFLQKQMVYVERPQKSFLQANWCSVCSMFVAKIRHHCVISLSEGTVMTVGGYIIFPFFCCWILHAEQFCQCEFPRPGLNSW